MCGHQTILIKQRNLLTSKTNVGNGGSFLNNFLKFHRLHSNGFIAEKALFGIADNSNLDSCPHPYLVQHNLFVFGLPHGAGGIGSVCLNLVCLHHLGKLSQNPAHFVHQSIADLSGSVCVLSQRNHVTQMINLLQLILGRHLINTKLQFKRAYIYGCKYMRRHLNPSLSLDCQEDM